MKAINLQEYKREKLLKEKPWRREIKGVNSNSPLGGLVQKFAWLMKNNIDVSEYELYLEAMEQDNHY